jgi:hypothetical protein
MPINYHPIFEQFLEFVGRYDMTADEATEKLIELYGEKHSEEFIVALLDNMGSEAKARRQLDNDRIRERIRGNAITVHQTREQMGIPAKTENEILMDDLIRKAAKR